jgi:hypothetical protein
LRLVGVVLALDEVGVSHGVGATGDLNGAAVQPDSLDGVTLCFVTGATSVIDGSVGLAQIGKHVDKCG